MLPHGFPLTQLFPPGFLAKLCQTLKLPYSSALTFTWFLFRLFLLYDTQTMTALGFLF